MDGRARVFSGIYPMLYAFFNRAGTLDRGAIARQVEGCVGRGADGIAVLGLATETAKLSPAERRQLVEWVGDDLKGRVPFAVTVFGASPYEQMEAVEHAVAHGAGFVVLQPPPERPIEEAELARFFAKVIESSPVPVAIQNAPEYLGVGLSGGAIAALNAANPRFSVLKCEAPSTAISRLIGETADRLDVFQGRGGLELLDNLRAGCAGAMPAPECFDLLVDAYDALRRGEEGEAERHYARALPAIVFVTQSIEHIVCYGKRLTALRFGLGTVRDRAPFLAPTPFGIAAIERYAARLGPVPEK